MAALVLSIHMLNSHSRALSTYKQMHNITSGPSWLHLIMYMLHVVYKVCNTYILSYDTFNLCYHVYNYMYIQLKPVKCLLTTAPLQVANALLGLATEAFVAAQLASRDASITALQGAKADATLLASYATNAALSARERPRRNPRGARSPAAFRQRRSC